MIDPRWEESFRYILKDVEEDIREPLIAALKDEVEQGGTTGDDYELKDRNIYGSEGPFKGGAVFRPQDLVTFADVLRVMRYAFQKMSPIALAQAAYRLYCLLRDMRAIREELNEDEFRIIVAVANTDGSLDAIVEYAERDIERVKAVLGGLEQRMYKGEIPLVYQEEGLYKTEF